MAGNKLYLLCEGENGKKRSCHPDTPGTIR